MVKSFPRTRYFPKWHLVTWRDQLLAHLDADASDFVGEPGNRVVLAIVR